LNLIQGISPLSFIDLRTASVSFRFVTQLKTLTKQCFQPACHPVKSTTPNPANKAIKYWCQDETRLGLKTIESKKNTAFGVKPIGEVQGNFLLLLFIRGSRATNSRKHLGASFHI
jgi:hypothetical protein